jgi:drug/metabolite transporter (DMT)-like permease
LPADLVDAAETPAGSAGVSMSHARDADGIDPTGARRGTPRIVPTRTLRLAELGVLVTVAIWSANFVLVKGAIGVLAPLTFAGARFTVAAATLLVILRLRHAAIRPPSGQLGGLLLLGALGFGGYQVLWTLGLTTISAGDSALIVAASPVLTVLLAALVGVDQLTVPKATGSLIAFAGVAIVIGAGQALSLGSSVVGELLTLAAAATWAVYTVGGTRMLRRVDPLQATAWTVVGGLPILIPLAIADGAAHGWAGIAEPGVLIAIVVSGSLAAGIANVLVFNAIRYVGPARATTMQLLVPAGAVLLGALFLQEPVGVWQLAGGAVIVGGVWLTRRASIGPMRSFVRRIPSRP